MDGVALSRTDAARDPYTPVASSRVGDILREQADLTVAEVTLDVVLSAGEALVGALDADVDVLPSVRVAPCVVSALTGLYRTGGVVGTDVGLYSLRRSPSMRCVRRMLL